MDWFVQGIVEGHWGDLASVAGFVVALIGFAFTLFGVWRSKSAAEKAEEAASGARDAIVRSATIADFSAAITMLEEIKRLHRFAAWPILPDRYGTLRRLLVALRTANPDMSDDFKKHITGAVAHLATCERVVEEFLAAEPAGPPNMARLNIIMSDQVDKLSTILETLKRDIGR